MTGSLIDGTIPSQLGGVKTTNASDISAMFLYLGTQYVSGTVPTQLGGMALYNVYADFENNYLTASLPTQLGQLSRAAESSDTLNINYESNKLCNDLPTEIAYLTKGG